MTAWPQRSLETDMGSCGPLLSLAQGSFTTAMIVRSWLPTGAPVLLLRTHCEQEGAIAGASPEPEHWPIKND